MDLLTLGAIIWYAWFMCVLLKVELKFSMLNEIILKVSLWIDKNCFGDVL